MSAVYFIQIRFEICLVRAIHICRVNMKSSNVQQEAEEYLA